MGYTQENSVFFLKSVETLLQESPDTNVSLVVDDLVFRSSKQPFDQLQKDHPRFQIRILEQEFDRYTQKVIAKEANSIEEIFFDPDSALKIIAENGLRGDPVLASDLWRIFYVLNENENNTTFYFDIDTWLDYFGTAEKSPKFGTNCKQEKGKLSSPAVSINWNKTYKNDLYIGCCLSEKSKLEVAKIIREHVEKTTIPFDYFLKDAKPLIEKSYSFHMEKIREYKRPYKDFVLWHTGPILANMISEKCDCTNNNAFSYSFGGSLWVEKNSKCENLETFSFLIADYSFYKTQNENKSLHIVLGEIKKEFDVILEMAKENLENYKNDFDDIKSKLSDEDGLKDYFASILPVYAEKFLTKEKNDFLLNHFKDTSSGDNGMKEDFFGNFEITSTDNFENMMVGDLDERGSKNSLKDTLESAVEYLDNLHKNIDSLKAIEGKIPEISELNLLKDFGFPRLESLIEEHINQKIELDKKAIE
jgi:hypothetical protein